MWSGMPPVFVDTSPRPRTRLTEDTAAAAPWHQRPSVARRQTLTTSARTLRPRDNDRGVAETLDSVLKERVRAVIEREPVTEAELRKLLEDGRACALILRARFECSEQTLAELAADPTSSLAKIAAAFRDLNDVRPDLDELETLLARLQERAREFRASWLSTPSTHPPRARRSRSSDPITTDQDRPK